MLRTIHADSVDNAVNAIWEVYHENDDENGQVALSMTQVLDSVELSGLNIHDVLEVYDQLRFMSGTVGKYIVNKVQPDESEPPAEEKLHLYLVDNIEWDTDDDDWDPEDNENLHLPTKICVVAEDDEDVVDILSDTFGFCIYSLEWEVTSISELLNVSYYVCDCITEHGKETVCFRGKKIPLLKEAEEFIKENGLLSDNTQDFRVSRFYEISADNAAKLLGTSNVFPVFGL